MSRAHVLATNSLATLPHPGPLSPSYELASHNPSIFLVSIAAPHQPYVSPLRLPLNFRRFIGASIDDHLSGRIEVEF